MNFTQYLNDPKEVLYNNAIVLIFEFSYFDYQFLTVLIVGKLARQFN